MSNSIPRRATLGALLRSARLAILAALIATAAGAGERPSTLHVGERPHAETSRPARMAAALPAPDTDDEAAEATPADDTEAAQAEGRGLARENVVTDFNPDVESPRIDASSYLDPLASAIGDVTIGKRV